MSLSEKKKASNRRYLKEKLDHISFRVPKGQREVIQAHAEKMGESMNAFIARAVEQAMLSDKEDT
jgi:uncharacterized protein (DUF1778 family)